MEVRLIDLALVLFLSACSGPALWEVDSIMAGDLSFDSSKMTFCSPEAHPPLNFALIRFGNEIGAFLTLNRFHFTSDTARVILEIEDEIFEDLAAVYEGRMRLKLSSESTKKVIQSLQDGKEVVILVDGFREKLEPSQFSLRFGRFSQGGSFFNFIKGPLP